MAPWRWPNPLWQVAPHGSAWRAAWKAPPFAQHGIRAPILVLGPTWPEKIGALIDHRLTPTVGNCEDADPAESHEAARRGLTYPMHLKIDTSMSRYGVMPHDCTAFLNRLEDWPNLHLQGVMTHLATADAPEDGGRTRRHLDDFRRVLQTATNKGVRPRYVHAAGSAGIFRYPESHGNLVRPGISLYGSHPFPSRRGLRPASGHEVDNQGGPRAVRAGGDRRELWAHFRLKAA